jgi:hypothetical protein
VVLLAGLIAVPVLFLSGTGLYYLWISGWAFYAWWPMAACLATAYLLSLYWHRKQHLLRPLGTAPPLHWTERDRQAWNLVQSRAAAAAQRDPNQLSEIQVYVDTAQEMASELARFYYPRSPDPIGALTIPEILAVIELAAHDMAELVDQYLPGGHLLTVNNWRQARKAADWWCTGKRRTVSRLLERGIPRTGCGAWRSRSWAR